VKKASGHRSGHCYHGRVCVCVCVCVDVSPVGRALFQRSTATTVECAMLSTCLPESSGFRHLVTQRHSSASLLPASLRHLHHHMAAVVGVVRRVFCTSTAICRRMAQGLEERGIKTRMLRLHERHQVAAQLGTRVQQGLQAGGQGGMMRVAGGGGRCRCDYRRRAPSRGCGTAGKRGR